MSPHVYVRETAIAQVQVWVVNRRVDCSPAVTGGKGEDMGPGVDKQMYGGQEAHLIICFPQRNR